MGPKVSRRGGDLAGERQLDHVCRGAEGSAGGHGDVQAAAVLRPGGQVGVGAGDGAEQLYRIEGAEADSIRAQGGDIQGAARQPSTVAYRTVLFLLRVNRI